MTTKKLWLVFTGVMVSVLSSFTLNTSPAERFPYAAAGLSKEQAAAHLASRFTFGATPELVEEIKSMGLVNWFRSQLKGDLPDRDVKERLRDCDLLSLSNTQVVSLFPEHGQVLKMAVADGVLNKDSLATADRADVRKRLKEYKAKHGIREDSELRDQFIKQKIVRAAYGRNQLHEVLTDFWFNHFNVSATKNQAAKFIPAYERDVIRPNVEGRFEDLLIATAQSPAMLFYLDNATSMGVAENLEEVAMNPMPRRRNIRRPPPKKMGAKKNGVQGLNENYAREIMELHTLGVDGGYTQQDVTEAARVLTGWTVYPVRDKNAKGMRARLDALGDHKLRALGFVHRGDFLFAINRHDAKSKTVLNHHFPDGGGYEEGVELLHLLAEHPSTAKFISKKLAIRFVSDEPPASLVDRMAATYASTHGAIREVLMTMVLSPEFWDAQALRSKAKSPFEYAISSVRSLHADITTCQALNHAITRMGQELYKYAAPTGFPDRGQFWINTGSLLNRMNFGLAIAANRIKGVRVDIGALTQGHEPESAEAALTVYSNLLLPGRDVMPTVQRLQSIIKNPQIGRQVELAARRQRNDSGGDSVMVSKQPEPTPKLMNTNAVRTQVVGIILGSPEFQRR